MTSAALTLRAALPADGPSLERLAALDSAKVPSAPQLVAVSDGELIAALSVRDGAVVADPFRPTREPVDLLRRWAGRRAA